MLWLICIHSTSALMCKHKNQTILWLIKMCSIITDSKLHLTLSKHDWNSQAQNSYDRIKEPHFDSLSRLTLLGSCSTPECDKHTLTNKGERPVSFSDMYIHIYTCDLHYNNLWCLYKNSTKRHPQEKAKKEKIHQSRYYRRLTTHTTGLVLF